MMIECGMWDVCCSLHVMWELVFECLVIWSFLALIFSLLLAFNVKGVWVYCYYLPY